MPDSRKPVLIRAAAWFRKSILRRLILVIFTVVAIPLILFSAFLYASFRENTLQQHAEAVDEILIKTTNLINRELQDYLSRSKFVATNNEIPAGLEIDYGDNLVDKVVFYNAVNIFMNRIIMLENTWENVFRIYMSNPTLYENRVFRFLAATPDYPFIVQEVLTKSSETYVWKPDLVLEEHGERYIILYRNLMPEEDVSAVLATMIPFTTLEFYLDNSEIPSGSMLIYRDGQGSSVHAVKKEIFSLPESAAGGGLVFSDQDYSTRSMTLLNGHSLLMVTSRKALNRTVMLPLIWGILLLAGVFTVIIFISAGAIRRITESLMDFIHTIQDDTGDLQGMQAIRIQGVDEVAILKRRFRELALTIQQLNQENMTIAQKTSQLEIDLLQARINPHLLYNSLSVIRYQAMEKHEAETVAFIDALTRYYRRALNRGDNMLTFREELEMIREYVRINNYTQHSEFILNIAVPDKIQELLTYKHLLQPVVENSIMHGLIGRPGEKIIDIRAEQRDELLIFTIEDNGYGMSRETAENIMQGTYSSEVGGYGMRNLIDRIYAAYGYRYGLTIESEADVYTRVILTLPAVRCLV